MDATRIILSHGLIFFLLQVAGGHYCYIATCPKEETCSFNRVKKTPVKECRFVLALDEECSFKGAMGGSVNDTEDYVKNLTETSTKNLRMVHYTTTRRSIFPSSIVSNNPDLSSKWTLDTSLTDNSACKDETSKILCTLLAGPGSVDVNKTMCPDPTTTTMVSTTPVLATSKVYESTQIRTVFTKEAVPAAPAKNEATSGEKATALKKVLETSIPKPVEEHPYRFGCRSANCVDWDYPVDYDSYDDDSAVAAVRTGVKAGIQTAVIVALYHYF